MTKTVKDLFDEQFKTVKFNKDLAERLYKFQMGFVNKNSEHLAFFGSNMIGVHTVRFTPRDESVLYYEVLGIDPNAISDGLDDVPTINKNFIVSSDVFNLTMLYVIHRCLTSELLDNKKKEFAATQAGLILNYRLFTGLLSWYFKYPLDEETAKKVYENLSYKFLIKKLGSWQAVLHFRVQELLNVNGIHYKALNNFNNDADIVYAINDTQGRLRDMMKNLYKEVDNAKKSQSKIYSNSSTMVDTDGVEVLRDKIHGLETYTKYILNVVPDKGSFIRTELVGVILKIMPTAQEHMFIKILNALSENIEDRKYKYLDDIIKLTIVHSYNYLKTDSTVLKNTHDFLGFYLGYVELI